MPHDSQPGLAQLLSICRWGHRFYTEAAEASRRRKQTVTLLKLELQRADLAAELQSWVDHPGPADSFLPLVRAAGQDDERILELCDRLDEMTIQAYERQLNVAPQGRLRSVLQRHLEKLVSGVAFRGRLREEGR